METRQQSLLQPALEVPSQASEPVLTTRFLSAAPILTMFTQPPTPAPAARARTQTPAPAARALQAALALLAMLAFACALGGGAAWAAQDGGTAWAAQGDGADAGLAAGRVSTQANKISGLDLVEESDPNDNHYDSPDGKVSVSSYTSGSASYDAQTSTLTIADLRAGLFVKGDVTLSLGGSNRLEWLTASDELRGTLTVKGTGSLTLADGYLSACGYKQVGGTVSASDTLQAEADALVSGGTLRAGTISAGNYTQKGGAVALGYSLDADGAAAVLGGTLAAQSLNAKSYSQGGGAVTLSSALATSGDATISKGTLTANEINCKQGTCKVSGGTATVKELLESTSFIMSGGSLAAFELNGFKSVEVSGGSIAFGKGAYGIYSAGSVAIAGGSIAMKSSDGGITAGGSIVVSGGAVTLKGCSDGIGAGRAFTMTGGKVVVTGCDTPIAAGKVYSGTRKPKSGTVKILGGSLTAKSTEPGYEAILTKSFSCKDGCIKAVYGSMPDGFKFTYKKNRYIVRNGNAALLKYNSTAKKATFTNAKFGGYVYAIVGVAPNAFNTKAGREVRQLTFDNDIEYLGKNAFANTKSLTFLLVAFPNDVVKLNGNGFVAKVSAKKGSYAKKAFANCGKSKGKDLELAVNNVSSKYDKKGFKLVKKLLYSHGLSKKVRVA